MAPGDAPTSAHLDYLQRTALEPAPLGPHLGETRAPSDLRHLVHVRGIGRHDKGGGAPAGATGATDPAPVATGTGVRTALPRFHAVTEGLLVGLCAYQVPVAFLVEGRPGSLSVGLGTWLPEGGGPDGVAANAGIVRALLASLYPTVDVGPGVAEVPQLAGAGLALGVPAPRPPDPTDPALPIDRLARSLAGAHWAVLVLAQPVSEAFAQDERLRVINEMRATAGAARAAGTPSPLADHYVELLASTMAALTHAQAVGAWRTAAYLLGDDADGYHRLASAWRGTFAGEGSLPEPVRVWERPEAAGLAARWALPASPSGPVAPPGLYRRPFEHQTLLTSTQLAAYVHLPEVETGGYAVSLVPGFDSVPPAGRAGGIAVGHVVERGRPTAQAFEVAPAALTRHAFVAGVTGSGKTNTVFHLLRQVAAAGTPFLVIEPAKAEYRALLGDPQLGRALQVFTPGNEAVSPFRLNPFEVPEGVAVGVHLDLLRSVFAVSFGMWTPLPQVLETCLHRIYEDRGWDVTSGRNRRLDARADRSRAFPTLGDLVAKVDEVVAGLGYDEKVASDVRAALRTRLDSLRTGGKGRMLDVRRSTPLRALTAHPTVVELEGLGDDDDKAFVMGLLMIRLVEQLRVTGPRDGLGHLLVIEEAHRLLAATGRSAGAAQEEYQADVRGKAVETFANLLSEIRAYGQGVLVVDQVPTKLAPEVVKNTNLKVAHRIVAGDDRHALAAAMAMDDRQARALATLRVGQAAVFADGEDAPLLLQVPAAKGPAAAVPDAAAVRERMAAAGLVGPGTTTPTDDCDEACARWPDACAAVRRALADPVLRAAVARTTLSAVLDPAALDRLRPELEATVAALAPPWVPVPEMLAVLPAHAAHDLAARWGARASWPYGVTDDLARALHDALAATDPLAAGPARAALAKVGAELLAPGPGPFGACARVWAGAPPPAPCACRVPVAEALASGTFRSAWAEAGQADAASDEGGRAATWEVCQDVAYQVVEFPGDDWPDDLRAPVAAAASRIALCVGQQCLATDPTMHPRTKRRVMDKLLREAGVDAPER